MSKFMLGQRKFPTLGLRSQQPKNYFGPTLSCYLGGWDQGFYFVQFGAEPVPNAIDPSFFPISNLIFPKTVTIIPNSASD